MKCYSRGLVALGITLLLTACGSPNPRATVTTEVTRGQVVAPANDLSLNDVYQRMTQAITREGSVFHASVRLTRAELTPPLATPTPGGQPFPPFTEIRQEIWLGV